MLAVFRAAAALAFGFMLVSSAAGAQVSAIEGDVKGADGQPVKGAQILIERKDKKGTYRGASTNKNGHFIYNGLPIGDYTVILIVDDNTVDKVDDVRTRPDSPMHVVFDLRPEAAKQHDAQRAAENDRITSALPASGSAAGPSSTNPVGESQIRNEIEQIAAADASPLPAPLVSDRAISGSSVSRTLDNQTTYVLVVLLTGPIDKRVEVPAGTKQTFEIPAGRYKVAARLLAPDFPALLAVEEYVSGHDYRSDFIIEGDRQQAGGGSLRSLDKTNLSGHWTLVSQSGNATNRIKTLEIEVAGPVVTLNRGAAIYYTDGRPAIYKNEPEPELSGTAHWNGDVLVINTESPSPKGFVKHYIQYSTSADGRTLTRHVEITGPIFQRGTSIYSKDP